MESFEQQLERLSKDFVWLEDYEVSNLPDEERWTYINKRKLIWDTNSMCRMIETARKDAKQKVEKEKIEKEKTEGTIEWKIGVIINLLKIDKLTIFQIADAMNVDEELVIYIKEGLQENN